MVASKLFPFGVGSSLDSSFKLLLVAEGFTAAQRGDFGARCTEVVEALLSTTPFNRTRARPEWLTVLKLFAPSASAGPRPDNTGPVNTVLGSYVDAATHRLVIDHTRLTTLLQAQVVTTAGGTQPLAGLFTPGRIQFGLTGALIAVLTPTVASPAGGADDHVRPAADEQYHLVATTTNDGWPQVVLRGIGAALGLADEFERSGAAHAAATADAPGLGSAPNVVFSDSAPVMNADVGRWRHLMSAVELLAPAVVHAHAPNDLPDTVMPAAPSAAGRIAFWEGAGGFRRKAYRSAQDCLMRRAPGLGYLSARATPAYFCPACSAHLAAMIG